MNAKQLGIPKVWCPLTLSFTLALFVWQAFGSTLTVTNLADSGPGTLREQIAAANPGDTIEFSVSGTILLNSELTISNDLTISGNGPGLPKVSGNHSTRVFNITSGFVGINYLTISDGRMAGTNGATGHNGENVYGGGVLIGNGATAYLWFCIVSNNVAIGGDAGSGGYGGNGYGGGICSLGTLLLQGSEVVSNSAFGGSGGSLDGGGQAWGGGLYVENSALVVWSTIHANSVVGGPGGGGLGGGSGAGIYNVADLSVTSSTIVSNAAASAGLDFGGGIDNNGSLTIRDSTIVGNQADYGGGITGGDIGNTILAGNSAGTGPDASGTLASSDYNLVQNTSGVTFTGTTTHNIYGQDPLLGPLQDNGSAIPPLVILTMSPLPGSPVIDQGYSTETSDQRGFSRPYDTTLPNAAGGNGADIGAVEVNPGTLLVQNTNDSGPGSLRQALSDNSGLGGSNTIVFSNSVTGTITLTSEKLTVAVPAMIRGPGPGILSISGNNSFQVFNVLEGPTEISGLTICNGTVNGGVASQGNNGFDVRGGGIFNQSILTLSNCVVCSNSVIGGTGGDRYLTSAGHGGIGYGGGLYNAGGTFFLFNCTFHDNTAMGGAGGNGLTGDAGYGGNGLGGAVCTIAGSNQITACSFINNVALGGAGGASSGGASGVGGQGYGAGLYTESSVIVTTSTFSGGSAIAGTGGGGNGNGYGGGIYNVTDLALDSSTIASNSATGNTFDTGGGIYNVGTLGITNSTIAGNDADYGGGLDGFVTVANTIIAGNSAGTGPDVDGTIHSQDYNLIQSLAGASMDGTTNHVLIGQDPLLGPLRDNGGPNMTMALLDGSPAIDQGKNFGMVFDERGVFRPYDLASIANAGGGDGSDIGAFEFLPTPFLHIQPADNGNITLFWSSDAADFLLESLSNLPAGNNWLEVTNSRALVGNQVYVTNSAAGATKFYRLNFPLTTVPPD